MSYSVRVNAEQADGTFGKNDPTQSTAYKILESGVLQLIEFNFKTNRWEIKEEFAPQAWSTVSGTRYVGTTDSLRGSDSSIANGVRSD